LQCDYHERLIPQGLQAKAFTPKLGQSSDSVEMMGLIGAGNNSMVGMTVAVAVAIEEASK